MKRDWKDVEKDINKVCAEKKYQCKHCEDVVIGIRALLDHYLDKHKEKIPHGEIRKLP